MKTKKINNNEVYIVNKYTHNLLSVVIVDEFNKESHDSMYELSKRTDILFIFLNENNKTKGINKRKFSTLYGAIGFIVSEGNVNQTLVKLLKYTKEIINSHVGILLFNSSVELKLPILEKVIQINNSSIKKPILTIRRCTLEELEEIFTVDNSNECGKNLWNIFKRREENSELSMYCNYKSESSFIYLSNSTVDSLLRNYDSPEYNHYLHTFKDRADVRDFLASYIKRHKISNLNYEISEVNLLIN